jgi:hypothetical protein
MPAPDLLVMRAPRLGAAPDLLSGDRLN